MELLTPLPIDDIIESIKSAFQINTNLVITAAPGAGKTTRLPPSLLKVFRKKILVLEPRRMAAIAAAHRIAEEQNWEVGKEVGYQVRFANKLLPETRLIFMTEALLARKMIQDPELNEVDLVILDEFHERSVHVDLALGLIRELQQLGRNIKLLVMSATLDAEKISAYLDNCPQIKVPGKIFELDIRYQKNSQLLQTNTQFFDNLFQMIKEAQAQTSKDILVFLPGVGEIQRAQDGLQTWAQGKKIKILPLHGTLSLEDQKIALKKSPEQRLILATNIAESSVTLDGVNTVIDSGLAKNMKQDLKTGFSRLELSRISLSSATQRAGRAARQFPGVCYRLWNKMDELSFSKNEMAEIHRIDLSESLLFLSAQGVSDFESFTWFEKPSPLALKTAIQFLKISEALDDKNKLTDLGKKILNFPLPVRLGRLILIGQDTGSLDIACDLAALLQERDILNKESVASFIGDQLECDLTPRIEVFREYRDKKKVSPGTSSQTLKIIDQSAKQILDSCKHRPNYALQKLSADELQTKIKVILLQTYADRLCRRRGNADRALMVGGRGVKLRPESLVRNSEFFVAISGVEGSNDSETAISFACGFTKDFILTYFGSRIEKIEDITFIEDKGQFFKREYRALFGLPLEEPTLIPAAAQDIAAKLPQILSEKFDMVLKQNPSLDHWWSRLDFLNHHQPLNIDFNKLKFEALSQACMGEIKLQEVINKDLNYFFEAALPQDILQKLKKEIPSWIEVPSGSRIRVHYFLDKAPYLEVRIQEVFGLKETPKVFFGKIPITIHLLAPNFRPVQVTSNLKSFWKQGYAEVRKELRIKYPKHQWPEDPAEGVPEAKGRRRP
jgi:ATP-dependent helicase HrpB